MSDARLIDGPWGCPAEDCSAPAASQRPLSLAERGVVLEDWETRATVWQPERLRRCDCCGAVYRSGPLPGVIGYLDGPGWGQGWRPLPIRAIR